MSVSVFHFNIDMLPYNPSEYTKHGEKDDDRSYNKISSNNINIRQHLFLETTNYFLRG